MSARNLHGTLLLVVVTTGCGGVTDAGTRRIDDHPSAAGSEGQPRSGGGSGGTTGRNGSGGTVASAAATDAGTSGASSGGDGSAVDTGVDGGRSSGSTDGSKPPRDAGVDVRDVDVDAPPACLAVNAVFSRLLLGPWDCSTESFCTVLPPAGLDSTCRESGVPGTYVYRSRACWDQWHPGSSAGDTVDFTKEMVLTACNPGACGEQLIYDGTVLCGDEARVTAHHSGGCDTCESTCNTFSVALVLPGTVQRVFVTLPSGADDLVLVSPDGAPMTCQAEQAPWCPDPSNPVNDTCWRACSSDTDCTLVETSACGCAHGGKRVAIRNQLATAWPFSWACGADGGAPDRCNDCSAGNAGARAACVGGLCTVTCEGNISTCTDGILNGTETDIDCGGPCPPCGGCAPGLFACSGACVDLLSDTNNCGGCGKVCPFLGGGRGCFQGICSETGSCPGCGPTLCDCDGLAANGCETNLSSNPLNCGACGLACVLPHAAASCLGGVCAVGGCDPGYGDCDGNAANGCESELATDRLHCGSCSPTADCSVFPCSNCVAGVCGINDCGGTGLIMCEPDCVCTDTSRDVNNCGGCGVVCAFPHGTATCANYGCHLGACDAGYGDCDGLAANGCETDLRTDSDRCGTCGRSCNRPAGCPYSWCLGGTCYVPEGNPGFADCDCNPANGSETNLSGDPKNCGTCGLVCGTGQTCDSGNCR